MDPIRRIGYPRARTLLISMLFISSGLLILPVGSEPVDRATTRAAIPITMYLLDDGSFSDLDVTDYLNLTSPTCTTVEDFDIDAELGTTIFRGEAQDFELHPVLAGNLHIIGDVEILVYAKAATAARMGIQYELYDFDGIATYQMIGANFSQNNNLDWPITWTSWSLNLTNVDYTVPAGNHLVLRVTRNDPGGPNRAMHLAYNCTTENSRMILPTDTLINITDVETRSEMGTQKVQFSQGEEVYVWSNVSNPFTSSAILSANMTIFDPDSIEVVSNLAMTLEAVDASDPSGWKWYNSSYPLPLDAPVGNYTVNITAFGAGGITSAIETEFTVVTLNQPPVMLALDDHTVDEDIFGLVINFTSKATDDEDPATALSWEVLSFNGSLISDVTFEGNNTYNFSLVLDAFGSSLVEMKVSDTLLENDTGNFTITVNPVNDPPVILGTVPDFMKDEDDINWSFDLGPLASDIEDDLAGLTWTVSNVNSSLQTIIMNGHIMNFSLVANISGEDLINLTLEDSGGKVDETSFWVNVSPVNDRPTWGLIQDVNIDDNSSWEDILNLTIFVSDIDNRTDDLDISIVSYTLDDQITLTLNENGTIDLIEAPDALNDTSNVTVRVSDGIDFTDTNFNIMFDLTSIPVILNITTRLVAPKNNSVVGNGTVTLRWTEASNSTQPEYMIFMSVNKDDVLAEDIGAFLVNTNRTSYDLAGPLTNGTSYYWTVIPFNGSSRGINLDGLWIFTVDLGYVQENHSFEIRTSTRNASMLQGDIRDIIIEVVNTGNTQTTVIITLSGTYKGAHLNRSTIVIEVGETKRLRLTLDIPRNQAKGEYTVVLSAVSAEDSNSTSSLVIDLEIKRRSDPVETFSAWWVIPIAIFLIIIGIGMGVWLATRQIGPPRIPPSAPRPSEDDDERSDDEAATASAAVIGAGGSAVVTPPVIVKKPEGLTVIMYLSETPKQAIMEFLDRTGDGTKGLCLIPSDATDIKGLEDKEDIKVTKLVDNEGMDGVVFDDLKVISRTILEFFDDKDKGTLLVTYFHRFLLANGVDGVDDLLNILMENFADKGYVLLFHSNPNAFDEQDIERLKKDFTIIEIPSSDEDIKDDDETKDDEDDNETQELVKEDVVEEEDEVGEQAEQHIIEEEDEVGAPVEEGVDGATEGPSDEVPVLETKREEEPEDSTGMRSSEGTSQEPVTETAPADVTTASGVRNAAAQPLVVLVPKTPVSTEGLEAIELQWGDSMLIIDEDCGWAFNLFKKYVDDGAVGLAISRYMPELVKEKYGLEKARVLWITIGGVEEDALPAMNMVKITHVVTQFLEKADDGILLFDAVKTLTKMWDIEIVLKMIDAISRFVSKSKCFAIIAVTTSDLEEAQMSRLESMFKSVFKKY